MHANHRGWRRGGSCRSMEACCSMEIEIKESWRRMRWRWYKMMGVSCREQSLATSICSPTRDVVSVQERGRGEVRVTEGPISASLGAMRPLVTKLDNLLLNPPKECSSKKVKDGMLLLRDDVEKISSCLDKLSEVEDPLPTTMCWMNEARDLSYKMEDYIDSLLCVHPADPSFAANNISTARSILKFKSCLKLFNHAKTTPKKLEWHRQIAATVLEFRKCAQETIQRRKVYVLSDSTTESTLSHRVMSVSHVLPTTHEETAVIVIDGRMNEFINSLVANDGVDQQQLKVVSVFGSACLGKTTLARVMYNKFGKEYHCRAFVQVSRKPDMKRIFRDMLSQLQWKDPPEYHNEVQLTENIKTYLRNKRYLIIIDDVWAASVFDIINHALPKGSQGSRIITTTQIEDVALTCCGYQSERVFEMKPLDEHHSRKLFFSVLFGSENDCPEQFKEDLNEIVVLCGGLPLATISIASLLASQPVMTEDLLKHISESLSCCLSASSTSERTRQALNLSFNNLPHHLKTCLLYLSMYPEGCTFSKHDLVKQWMAEGFLDTTEEQDKKKLAESYLHQLIGRRFIQPIRINYNNEVLSCVVHDTVHDLIAQRAVEENFIVAINYSQKSVALSHKARRLSLLFGDARYAKTPANILKSQVRSLAFSGILECMPCITEFKLLRVLNLQLSGHGGDDDGPLDLTGISELFKLRYLKISCDVCIILPNHLLLETLNIMNARVAFDPRDIRLPHLLDLSLPIDRNLRAWSLSMSSFGYLQDLNLTTSSTPSSFPGTDIEDLGSLISGHGNLKTVVVTHGSLVKNIVVHDVSKVTIYWNNMEPPPLLQRFEFSPHIGCIFSRIPQWVEKHENLCILKIAVRELLMNCVGILRGLRALTALSLHVETAPIDKIIFDKAGFSVLKYFKLRCTSGIALLNFEADAMPSLWKLKLVSNANPRMNQHQHGTAVIIIGHMPSLKEVSVKFGGASADVDYALRTFVSNHPRNPTINLQLVDYSSCGDESRKEKPRPDEILVEEPSGSNKQQPDEIRQDEPDESYKQQPDKIVEEEPDVSYKQRTDEIMEEEPEEYDKTLERLGDKRSLESLRIFTLDELMSATSNFSEENLLGEGIYGSTYKATIDGKLMAAVTKLTYSIRLPELQHLERMRHPNLVRLLGYCDHGMDSMLLYEYMPRGSLKYHLFNNNLISSISWSTRLNIAIRAAKGLAYLRESGNHIIYTFNASSILLDSDYTPKLFVFCLGKKDPQNKTAGSDVYNFGVVLLELLAGRPCVDHKRPGQERNLVEWSRPHLLSEDKLHHIMDTSMKGQYSVQAAWRAATTARLCLESAPKKRPSMCEVVEALEPLLALGEEHRLATKNWLPFEAHTERSPLSTSKRNIAVGMHSGIVATLQYKLNELMRQEYKLLAGIRGHITLFQGELWAMTRTVHYYESIDDHDVQIRSWVGQVRELAYDTDDWVDLLNHHIVASSHDADASTSWFSRWIRHGIDRLIDRHVIATELQELRQRVIKVNEHFDSHDLQIIMGEPTVNTQLIAPYLDSSSLVGLDQPRDEVIKMVTGAGWKKLEVVSIVGMAGSGKTALAKEVYRLISSEFKYHAVVSAGQSSDTARILSDMLSQVDGEYRGRSDAGDLTEWSLISRLREHIKDNRYLVLIDDLWSEETLWRIRSCLENQHDNRILTTTRIEEVAKASDHIYRTRLLNEADAETLFYQRAFGNVVTCPPHLKDVSDQIMRKCGGLPLALVSMGCLLARKTHTEDEFERYVLEWQDSQLEEMKQTIKLSCSNLSGQLKACLMCLSIFPENHEIEVERLVRLWIAEGFIHDDERGTSREEIGRQYVKWLISINLIQTSQLNHDGTARSCVLHPVIHDIIVCDSMEDNFVTLIHARQQDVPPGIGTVRRLSFLNSGKYDHDVAQIDGAKVSRTRSVTVFGHTSGMPPLNELSVLRVLDLEGCEGPLCLDGLCKLLLLRYLNLKGTDVSELPAQIGKLRFLETLDVRSTKVKELPPSILRLEKLVHLLAGNAKLPSGIGKLKSLLSLSCSNIGKSADMKVLQELSEMASLSELELFCDDTQTSGYKKQATFPSSGFRSLKKLSIWCSSPSVTFVAGALPKVEVLELKFEKCLSESSGVSGIEHLSGLKHMLIEFVQRDAATVAAVSKFAETAHPNCQVITVNVHRESEE